MHTVLVVVGVAAVMMAVEFLRPGRRFRHSLGWWERALAMNLVQAGSALLTALTWDRWLPSLALVDGSQLAFPLQVMTGYLLITFVYYWWHRARHEVPLLWRWLHQLHHSTARIEVIASFYKHPLEILLNAFLSAFVLHVLLGLSAGAVAVVVLITGLAELFYHWNIRTPYWLGFVFQRPESHCIHHMEGYHRNNYSDLPLWDMLFGTFENPRAQPGRCGFDAVRERQLGNMLLGRDVHADQRSSRGEVPS